MQYHHIGIPTDHLGSLSAYHPELGAHRTSTEKSPFGISWLCFEEGSLAPELLKSTPYIAFVVDDVDSARAGYSPILRFRDEEYGDAVFIDVNGVPVLLMSSGGVNKADPSYVYHSFWVPTEQKRVSEVHLPDLKMFVENKENKFAVGWVRYQQDAPYPQPVKRWPHLAFEVADMSEAIGSYPVLIAPNIPQDGLEVSFVEVNGIPVEFVSVDYEIHPNGV